MNTERPLVFIPGFKGSRLKRDHLVAWVNGFNAMGLTPIDLSLPLTWSDGKQDKDNLNVNGVVEAVEVIPWLLGEKVYGPFLKESEHWRKNFYAFAYDWRRDNNETAEQFFQFMNKVKADHGGLAPDVISHSMGGLIAFTVMNRDPGLFHKIVFAGVPFQGGVGFLPDMHVGTSTGVNKKILSPEVLFTFSSVYSLFPMDQSDCLDVAGQNIPVHFFEMQDWKKYGLGIFSRGAVSKNQEEFLTQALKVAKEFRAKIVLKSIAYPKALVILGDHFSTLSYAVRNGAKAVGGWDFESHSKIPGDGRVGANNLPPEGFPYDLQYTEEEHGHLLNSPKIWARIQEYLD